MHPLPGLTAAALALVLLATEAQAQDTLVTRCNVNIDGKFVPALIYSVGSTRTTITLGEAGLTRRILFSETEALDFVRARIGSTAGKLVYVDCGTSAGSDDPTAPPPAPPPPPPPPPPPDEDGGDDSTPGGGDDGYAL